MLSDESKTCDINIIVFILARIQLLFNYENNKLFKHYYQKINYWPCSPLKLLYVESRRKDSFYGNSDSVMNERDAKACKREQQNRTSHR